jgi:MerR family transcriptional regulator, light-induced transcriptional regulator
MLSAHSHPPAGLSIRQLAERTGVPAPTLRSWEARHGFPQPRRQSGGHRRYDERDVALVEEVLRLRESGLSMQTAIGRASAQPAEPDTSVFAGLRRRHPELEAQVLRKSTLLALSRAIEDECCARAARPVLFASFQHRRFYRLSRRRWKELARTAQSVVVFADFDRARKDTGKDPGKDSGPLHEVPVPGDAPLQREWMLVCDADDHPACLAGWEIPGQRAARDADRRFEVLWTVEPRAVRDAAQICVQLTNAFAPTTASSLSMPTGIPPAAGADLRRSVGLLNRMVGYVERAGEPPQR